MRVDEAFLLELAGRLHAGESWTDIARSLGVRPGELRSAAREAVQPYALALVNRDDPPTTHRAHGTRERYVVERCRCEPCRYANRVAEREVERRRRKGLEPYADATKAREHVRWLMANGVGLKRVGDVAGVSHGALSKLVYGGPGDRPPTKRIRAATGRKIVAVTLAARADGARVEAAPIHALVNAMVSNGWTRRAIAVRLGQRGPKLQLGRDYVSARNARAVEELYRTQPSPPPDARPRQRGGVGGQAAKERAREREIQTARRRRYRDMDREAAA